jgi:hypothetical protein
MKRITSLRTLGLPIAMSTLALAFTACGQGASSQGTTDNSGGTIARTDSSAGTATKSSASSAKIDPCALVTKNEATEFLGVEVKTKSENHDPDLQCAYESASGPQTYLKVEVMTRNGAQWLSNVKRGTEQRHGTVEPVSGIGDQSFINTEPDSPHNVDLTVLKGDILFSLKTLNVADAGEKLKTLAQNAVGRLP